jgi:hypothetical protein
MIRTQRGTQMNFTEERRRRQQFSTQIEMTIMRLNAAKRREQRDADEEGCGAVLCAIREARKQLVRENR